MQRVQIASNDFANITNKAWKHLWESRDFNDVTLVSGDGFRAHVHKAVLSFSSSFFREVFTGEPPHPSPLIYLRGVNQRELQFLLEFIYTGESLVEEDILQSLLNLGDDLGVEGLLAEQGSQIGPNCDVKADLGGTISNTEKTNESTGHPSKLLILDGCQEINGRGSETEDTLQRANEIDEEKPNDNDSENDAPETKTKTNSLMCEQCDYQTNAITKLNLHNQLKHFGLEHPCDICGFKAKNFYSLESHKSKKHGICFPPRPKYPRFDGFKCRLCPKEFASQGGLRRHVESLHGAHDAYKCEQCDFKTAIFKSLENHKQSVHEGVRYNCDQCDFKATTKGNVNVHIRTKHEGKRFKCDQCDHSVTSFNNLNNHKKSKHGEEANYKCDQCNFQLRSKQRLQIHVNSMHNRM